MKHGQNSTWIKSIKVMDYEEAIFWKKESKLRSMKTVKIIESDIDFFFFSPCWFSFDIKS